MIRITAFHSYRGLCSKLIFQSIFDGSKLKSPQACVLEYQFTHQLVDLQNSVHLLEDACPLLRASTWGLLSAEAENWRNVTSIPGGYGYSVYLAIQFPSKNSNTSASRIEIMQACFAHLNYEYLELPSARFGIH